MTRYYIHNNAGVGYIVAQLEDESNWFRSCRFVCNFGDRQSDAFEFRDDCNNGVIPENRIKFLMDKYTDTPYKYMDRGILKKQ